jgi:Carboxypeptidase regulatory-like domain
LAQQAALTSIVGRVTDPSGAAIPDVAVKAVEDGTQETYSGVTNTEGAYSFPFVRSGSYTITASAPGFVTFVRNRVLVEVNQVVRADIELPVGQLISTGRVLEGLAEARRAVELDPLSSSVNETLGWALYMVRQYDHSIEHLRRAVEAFPDFIQIYATLGMAYEAKGMSCQLTVDGHALWKNGPQVDQVPVEVNAHGLGPVPVWFLKLSEVQTILAGNKLTLGQLLASPSLQKALAKVHEENQLFGLWHPHGAGNGSLEIVADGSLEDGMSFHFEWRDMGKKDGNGQDFVRHVRIAFK